MKNPILILEELSILQMGLRMNFFSKERLVEYSDQLIMRESEPDELFIDISLSSHQRNKLIDVLGSFINSNRSQVETDKLMSIIQSLNSNGQLSLGRTTMLLYKLSHEFDFPEAMYSEINRLDDEYYLVSNQIVNRTEDELEIEVRQYLAPYLDEALELEILKDEIGYDNAEKG
ncbi:hypothetical protein [Sanyastnella coralliicola]|uniref:hypothetical protein n=1 Tax=Sanyastnella coralliicola TaxID=3069118 RepID=UPI0027B9A13F|nr:hypothetical protein [Longitalea sp. SCSIO 12813]